MIFGVGGLGLTKMRVSRLRGDRKEESWAVHGRLRQIESLKFERKIER